VAPRPLRQRTGVDGMDWHLTDLEQLLLLATLRVGDGAYAAALLDDLVETADRSVSLGTIYVTMVRLEERGLVASELGEPTAQRGGKAKRLYRVTEEGREALERTRAILERMWRGVGATDTLPEGT
jgi:DNA-binding PadR family transcriptional regulator